jgi:beta-lactamase class A
MASRLDAVIAGVQGHVSAYAQNLDTGREWGINPDERVRTASTIKLPIACAVVREVTAGRAGWSETLAVGPENKVSGSGVLADFSDGARVSLRDALTLMIIVSDNTATNMILDRFGADTVNETMDSLGLKATRSMRKIRGDGGELAPAEGWSKAGREPGNERFGIGSSSPREMVRLLGMLTRGEVVDAAGSRLILETLQRQQYKEGIGRHAGDLVVASKSGALDALRSDVGIVHTPQGRIAIAVTIDGMPVIDYSPDNVGEKAIWEISRILMSELH